MPIAAGNMSSAKNRRHQSERRSADGPAGVLKKNISRSKNQKYHSKMTEEKRKKQIEKRRQLTIDELTRQWRKYLIKKKQKKQRDKIIREKLAQHLQRERKVRQRLIILQYIKNQDPWGWQSCPPFQALEFAAD